MTTKPLVSILLLNYNNQGDTIDCIESLKEIEYSNYNILLVDNSSNDDSAKQFKHKYRDIEIVVTPENLGYTGGINYGLKILSNTDTDYILIINNDTLVEKDFLCYMVEGMELNKNAAAACCTILEEHERSTLWYAGGKMIGWRGLAVHNFKGKNLEIISGKETSYTQFVTGCLILLRKSELEKIGFEDERFFMYLDDIEYSQRMVNKGYELLYIPKAKIYHKVLGEKESPFKLYYSVRNRLLLIKTAFKGCVLQTAYVYFILVISLKLLYWKIKKPEFYSAAKQGLKDYFDENFGRGNGFLFYK